MSVRSLLFDHPLYEKLKVCNISDNLEFFVVNFIFYG